MPLTLDDVAEHVRRANYNITKHGYEELDKDGITIAMLEVAIGADNPEVIEDYPNDQRGSSCLIVGWYEADLPLHMCVAVSGTQPEIITAYKPSSLRFRPPDFRRRR